MDPELLNFVFIGGAIWVFFAAILDSNKTIKAYRSLANRLDLSIENDARLAALLQAPKYQPRIWGRYREVNIAVRVSNSQTEDVIDDAPRERVMNDRLPPPVTVFEASLTEATPARAGAQKVHISKTWVRKRTELDLNIFNELKQVRPNARMREDTVVFLVKEQMSDSEIMKNIEVLVDCVHRARSLKKPS